MAQNKEQLEKLLKFIDEISNQKGNEWFKKDLIKSIIGSDANITSTILDELYEYCIQSILKNQAERFYGAFKLVDIKPQLEADFIRMEQFRRSNNFEDFCLACFQQLEAIVNRFCDDKIIKYIKENIYEYAYKQTSVNTKLYEVLFFPKPSEPDLDIKLNRPIIQWSFAEKYKAVLYYYYFDKNVYNYRTFQPINSMGNDLYQARNLNHRGGFAFDSQLETTERIFSQSHKYYFRFLGFLEDFTTKVNENII